MQKLFLDDDHAQFLVLVPSSELSIIALLPGISRLKSFFSPTYCMLNGLYIFNEFVVPCIRSLSLDERLGF